MINIIIKYNFFLLIILVFKNMNNKNNDYEKCNIYIVDSTLNNKQNTSNLLKDGNVINKNSNQIENTSNDCASNDDLEIIDYPYDKINTLDLKYRYNSKKLKKDNKLLNDSSSSIISNNNDYNYVCNNYNNTGLMKNLESHYIINNQKNLSQTKEEKNKKKANLKKKIGIHFKKGKSIMKLKIKYKPKYNFETNLENQLKKKNKNNYCTIQLFKNDKSNLLSSISHSNENRKQKLRIDSAKKNKIQSNISIRKKIKNENKLNNANLMRFNNFDKKTTKKIVRNNNLSKILIGDTNKSCIFNHCSKKSKAPFSTNKTASNPFLNKIEMSRFDKHTQKNSGLMNKYITKIISRNFFQINYMK